MESMLTSKFSYFAFPKISNYYTCINAYNTRMRTPLDILYMRYNTGALLEVLCNIFRTLSEEEGEARQIFLTPAHFIFPPLHCSITTALVGRMTFHYPDIWELIKKKAKELRYPINSSS